MSKYKNTAGRILEILRRAAEQRSHKPREVWAEVFGLNSTDSTKIYVALAHMLVALDEVERQIRDTQKFPELLLREFDNVRKTLTPQNLNGGWGSYANLLTPAVMQGMEACADALPQEGEITQDEIAAVYTAVSSLFEQVNTSSLNGELKRAILALLAEVKRLMDQYRIWGPKAFREALGKLAGEMVLSRKAFQTATEEDKGFGERLWDVFDKLHHLAEKMTQIGTLLEYAGPAADSIRGLLEAAR